MHLILSHAASQRWPAAALQALDLPNLRRLLARMRHVQSFTDPDGERPHPLLPHERVLAQTLSWPDEGPWPFAARDTGTTGAQAWLTPCHWQVGMDRVVMLPPEALQLSDDESQQLLNAMQPYLAEDGLQVQWRGALRWLAHGDGLGTIAAASLARVSGQNIRPWITHRDLPGGLLRLQSEMQMLLYNHPVNDARLAGGQLPVNAFWLHGAGRMPATQARSESEVRCVDDLQASAQSGDVPAWQQSWHAIDRQLLAPLVQSSTPLALTLCSETAAHTWRTTPQGWHERLLRRWRSPRPDAVLGALLPENEQP